MSVQAPGYAALQRMPRGTYMVVSPHPDDAALSLGGTLAVLAGLPVRPRLALVTAFTRSLHAPGLAAGTRSDVVVSAVRVREEFTFADAINAELHLLDLPDASLRGYDDATERGTILAGDEQVPGLLALRLREIAEHLGPSVYWCPLGLGCHVDHVLARDAVLAIARPGTLLVFYEDLPYADGLEEDLVLSVVHALPVAAEPVPIDISDVWQAKLSFLLCYPSQVAPRDREAVEQVSIRRAVSGGSRAERLWIGRRADSRPSFLADC